MLFSKLKANDKGVELHWTTTENGNKIEHSLPSKQKPLPRLTGALAAFRDYVMDLLGLPEEWRDSLTISSLSISEDEDGRRGLIVTAIRKIDRASGRPLVLNTPHMRQPGDNGAEVGIYDEEIDELIDAAEQAAVGYINGEREQMDLLPSAPAEKAKREPKGKRGAKSIEGVTVVNEVGGSDDESLRQSLLAAGRDVPIDAIANWLSTDRDQAVRWAADRSKVRQGLLADEKARKEPTCVKLAATPALLEEQVAAGAAGRAD